MRVVSESVVPILANARSLCFPDLMRAVRLLLPCLAAIATTGCAVSVPIASMKASASDADITSSIKHPTTLSPRLDAEDWRRARAAMGTALDPQGNGSVVTWDNTQTGAKGSFVPVAQIYPSDDKICRAFLAKVETEGGLEDIQGTACRDTGEWTIRDVRPWKRA